MLLIDCTRVLLPPGALHNPSAIPLLSTVLCRCCVLQVGAKRMTLLELLAAYRSVPMDLQTLANLLPRLSPR